MTLQIVDLSSNNAQPWDFHAAKAAGISGAIIKATEGSGYIFDGFRVAWVNAKAAGLVVGAYHFARPASTVASEAADYFLAALPPLETGDIVALDIEEDGNGDLSAWALTWCRRVQAALGFVPLVYSYPDFINNHLTSSELTPYPLWLADLGAVPRASMPPWASVALRQYTWTGRYAGFNGDTDVSSFAGDVVGLRKLGKPASTPPVPATKHVTVPGSLKVTPDHASNIAIDPHLHAVYLEVGAAVVPTGKTSAEWSEIHLVPPEQVVHGWLLSANIA